jgi:hypothetical protein
MSTVDDEGSEESEPSEESTAQDEPEAEVLPPPAIGSTATRESANQRQGWQARLRKILGGR